LTWWRASPSIVIGLFVYSLVVITMGHFSGFAGAVALSLIMLPIIARTSEEMFKIVPRRLREGTMALAMPRWRAIVAVYIPTVAAGIVTGIVLAVSRAVGETAPLLFTSLGSNFVVTDLNQPMSALPLYMFQNALNIGFPAARERALGGRPYAGCDRPHLQRARTLARRQDAAQGEIASAR